MPFANLFRWVNCWLGCDFTGQMASLRRSTLHLKQYSYDNLSRAIQIRRLYHLRILSILRGSTQLSHPVDSSCQTECSHYKSNEVHLTQYSAI